MSDRTRQNAHAAIARRSWRRYGRPDDAGASLVEFAIILPVFVLMLFGMIQFGLGFAGWDELRNAVQTGARLAANDDVNPSDPNCGQTDPTQQMQLMVCEISLLIGQPLDTRPAVVDTPVPIPSDTCNSSLTSCSNYWWLDGYYILSDGQWLQIVKTNPPSSAQMITDSVAFADGSGTWTCTTVAGATCTQMTTNVSGQDPPSLGTDNVAIAIENNLVEVCAERFVVSLTSLPDLHSVHLTTASTFYDQTVGLTTTASTIPCG